MLKFWDFILNSFLFLFSYVFPKDKNLILFGSGNGKQFKGNPKYLYLYLHENSNTNKFKNLNYVWITQNNKVYSRLKAEGRSVLHKYSLKGFITILRANSIVIDQSAMDYSYLGSIIGRFNIIQTWHGTPLKKIGCDMVREKKGLGGDIKYRFRVKINEFFRFQASSEKLKLICSPSFEVSDKLKKAFNNDNVFLTGYPRNDVFFNKSLLWEENLNFIKYSKIISYIPTFRDIETKRKPFQNLNLKKFNEYCQVLKKPNRFFLFFNIETV